MAHIRKLVRDKARERLATIAGLTLPENVAANVVDTMLPAALVSTPTERVTAPAANQQTGGGGIARREITLVIVLVDEGDVTEDELDALAAQVETLLADDMDGLARFRPPVAEMGWDLERMSDEDGERWYSFAEMSFTFLAATELGNPEVVL